MATPQKPLNLIVACAENRVMGRGGRLPWRIPEDRSWFLEKTRGNVLVMGRICYEAWPQAHADGRRPIVITSRSSDALIQHPLPPGSSVPLIARSVQEALAMAQTQPGEIFICGGAQIFEETLPLAQRLFLTLVHAEVEGDVRFPEWRKLPWRETFRKEGADANYRISFVVLDR